MATVIQVVEKASHACFRCKNRKQGCDRLLPRCSRCASKLRRCDYSWHPDDSNHSPSSQSPADCPLVERGDCGLDLSSRGQKELLQLVLIDTTDDNLKLFVRFGQLVCDVLFESGVMISSLIDGYADTIHRWFPLLDVSQLRQEVQGLPEYCPKPAVPILLLAIMLVGIQPCGHANHLRHLRLYKTVKALVADLQSENEPSLEIVEAQALISLYECGHGMTQQAHLTLSSAVTNATLIALNSKMSNASLHWQAALMALDKMIFLSAIDDALPVLCTAEHPMVKAITASVQSWMGDKFALLDPHSQKLHMMAHISLLSGRCLQHAYCLKKGISTSEDYETIDAAMETMVQRLIGKEDSYSWIFCDSITLALCCHLIFREEHVKHKHAPPNSRDYLAWQTSRRMVWDTCELSIATITNAKISQLSFISMHSTFRAQLLVTGEDSGCATRDVVEPLIVKLRLFTARWAVGNRYLPRMEAVIASDTHSPDKTRANNKCLVMATL